jgi:hypothetical protein
MRAVAAKNSPESGTTPFPQVKTLDSLAAGMKGGGMTLFEPVIDDTRAGA